MRTHMALFALLAVAATSGCKSITNKIDTAMITRDEHAAYMGMKQMVRDVDECGTHSVRERNRLISELQLGDAYFEQQERNEAIGAAIGREIGEEFGEPTPGPGRPGRPRANGEIDTERLAGAAGAAAGSFLIGALFYDTTKHEQNMLTKDLENVHTFVRFKNICLRNKGYAVREYEEDGDRVAYLAGAPLRVLLRGEDGSEIVMYQRPRADED
jgi:hypothetical protein